MTIAITVAILVAGCAYLVLQRGLVRIILGFVLLSHAAHLTLMASGGVSRREPPLHSGLDPDVTADGLPLAMVLTAIVIAFAMTIYMLVLSVLGGDDDDSNMGDLDEIDLIDDVTAEQMEATADDDGDHLFALEDRFGRDIADGGKL